MRFKYLSWFIIGLGAILRLVQYLYNRSLWLDSAYLANNVLDLSYRQLTGYIQGVYAPIGFLWAEKLVTQILGNSEYALRLIPLLSGILSLIFFYKLTKYFLNPATSVIALSFFAISDTLNYYSTAVKQYTLDLLVALLVSLIAVKYLKTPTPKNLFILTIVGSLSIWFSQPVIFVLGGISATLLFKLSEKILNFKKGWRERQDPKIKINNDSLKLLVPLFFWFVNFTVYYFFFLKPSLHDTGLASFWQAAFGPSPTNIWKEIIGIQLLGFNTLFLPTFFMLGGLIFLFIKDKTKFSFLILPILLAYIASLLHLYPFTERFLLFLIPTFLIFIFLGVEKTFRSISHRVTRNNDSLILKRCGTSDRTPNYNYVLMLSMLIILVWLFYHPILVASDRLIHPITVEEIKPTIEYYQKYYQTGDLLYVYYGAIPAFRYYNRRYNINKSNYLLGNESRDKPTNYLLQISTLIGPKRLWLLFSHDYNWGAIDEEQFILSFMNKSEQLIQSYKTHGASIYLFQ